MQIFAHHYYWSSSFPNKQSLKLSSKNRSRTLRLLASTLCVASFVQSRTTTTTRNNSSSHSLWFPINSVLYYNYRWNINCWYISPYLYLSRIKGFRRHPHSTTTTACLSVQVWTQCLAILNDDLLRPIWRWCCLCLCEPITNFDRMPSPSPAERPLDS